MKNKLTPILFCALFLVAVLRSQPLLDSCATSCFKQSDQTFSETDPLKQKFIQPTEGTIITNTNKAAYLNATKPSYAIEPRICQIKGRSYKKSKSKYFTINCTNVEIWVDYNSDFT